MSKKYVIELEDLSFVNGSSYKKDILYRVKGFNSLVFDQNGLDKLEKFDIDYIKSHLDLGVLQESAYKKGYEDGLKAKDGKIRVGDEVVNTQTGCKFVVAHLWENNFGEKGASGFNWECSALSTSLELLKKTGRHFDTFDKLMEEMKA